MDISLVGGPSWQNIDLSSYVPSTASGAIVLAVNMGSSSDYSAVFRGTEDTRDYLSNPLYEEIEAYTQRWQIVKLDGSRVIQGFTESSEVDFKLLGYTSGGDPSYFTTPVDVTPAAVAAWTTVDVSASVDAEADGVVLLVDSISSEDRGYGIRETGSTDSADLLELEEYGNTMYLVGIDTLNQFSAYIQDSDVRIYLVAQTKGSVVYYVNNVPVADPAQGSWQVLDADDYSVAAEANGLILAAEKNKAGDKRLSFRRGGSTDDWGVGDIGHGTQLQAGVGLNDQNVWEEYMESDAADVWIAAYTRFLTWDVHADMDILVRQASGLVRATLASETANSGVISSATWQGYLASHVFPAYTVVDQTDYLEIDLFADSVTNDFSRAMSVDFRIDDAVYPVSTQTNID
ncbi:MAG: hypothetical protein O3A93_01940 [Chloroflexi bacterium]|nr:hypothetical protein [Chloroflexota bacterium]MDA1270008.1 hypothetical protein [Chloroflexota bacterium]